MFFAFFYKCDTIILVVKCMKNRKKILILALVILIISFFLDSFTVIDCYCLNRITILKITLLLPITMLCALYGAFYSKKRTYYIGMIISSCIYAFVIIKSIFNAYTFANGFYVYLLSFVIMLLSLLFDRDVKEKKDKKRHKKKTTKEKDNKKYVVGRYIYGIKKKPKLYNSPCVILKDNTNLKVLILSDPDVETVIPNYKIIDITYKEDILIKREDSLSSEEKKHIAKYIYNSKTKVDMLEKRLDDNSKKKMSFTLKYEVKIKYKTTKVDKELLIQTDMNPKEILEK